MRIGLDKVDQLREEDRRSVMKKSAFLAVLAIIVFFVFLNVDPDRHIFYSPLQALNNFRLWGQVTWAELTHQPTAGIYNQFPEDIFFYTVTFVQVKRLLITCACGMMLTLSGMIYQCVFRNPMAAPTVLGVTNGVNIAQLYLVITYGGAVISMPLTRYKYCYIGAAIMLVVVMSLGKFSSGKGRFSVNDLLLVGVALSGIVGAVLTAIMNGLDEDVLLTYQQVAQATTLLYDNISIICLSIAFCVSIIPMFLLRFSFNAVAYTPDEMRGLGMHPQRLRFVTLILGTFMITAAMIHCGAVGMMSLAVPHISRYIFGSEFRKMFWGNLFLGTGLLMLCRGIADLIPFGYQQFPLGVVVNIVVTPIFAYFMATSQRGWE